MKYLILGVFSLAIAAFILPFIKEEFVIKEANDEIEAPLDYEL